MSEILSRNFGVVFRSCCVGRQGKGGRERASERCCIGFRTITFKVNVEIPIMIPIKGGGLLLLGTQLGP